MSATPARSVGFPSDFVWGSGISAHQVEGGNDRNDWWDFEQAGHVAGGQASGRATDHYHRYAEDFALAADLGHQALKISIEWSRVEPERGVYDPAAIAHYVDVVRALRAVGITPYVVLHHFTNPRWLGEYGWWTSPRAVEFFGAYVLEVVRALSPWVDHWITINEPMLLASAGYAFGVWPPQQRGFRNGMRVARNLVHAHRVAYETIHEEGGICRVGPAVNVTAFKQPKHASLRDRLLGGPLDWLANYYFIDRVRDRSDFIGVQYYSRATVQQLLAGDPLAVPRGMRRLPRSDMGWEIYPKGLYYTVRDMHRRCGLPVIVTENGIADADDARRARFIRDHLVWLHRAMEEGADVRGYLHWALTDNFEWAEGFAPRFGLVGIDYDSLERTVRPSARFYEEICRSGQVPLDEPTPFDP